LQRNRNLVWNFPIRGSILPKRNRLSLGIYFADNRSTSASLIERTESTLVLLAYFIELDGDVHLPMFEKFEAGLNELRRKEGAKERARCLLSSYSRDGGTKAIEDMNLSLSSSGGPLPYLGLPVR
jgi:hypothetical protein